jgi:hypothetical protein
MRPPCCLCVTVSPLDVARQRLGQHVPAAANTQATIEEILEAVFSVRYVSYRIPKMQ